jgi:MFS family permease
MMLEEGLTSQETGIAMGVFAFGMFLPGGLCSFLVQHYRRNQVCVWAMLLLAASVLPPIYLDVMTPMAVILMRVVQGVSFGLAMMVLTSTLVIDTCESSQRTEANHSSSWFGRFALSLGPVGGLMLYDYYGVENALMAAASCCLTAVVLVLIVHIPFRTPNDHLSMFSFDRFLLVSSWPLLLNMFPVTIATGLLLSLPLEIDFYAYMMVGFLLALLAQRFVFPDAELKSEVVSGLILMIAALLIMMFFPISHIHSPLLALALGIIGSRFLLFFIKLSRHCQRGTAQSTFLLGWEGGLVLGVGIGYWAFESQQISIVETAFALIVLALALYVTWVHRWFMQHKNR